MPTTKARSLGHGELPETSFASARPSGFEMAPDFECTNINFAVSCALHPLTKEVTTMAFGILEKAQDVA